MKKFEFRLQRALEWRTNRLELEREKQRIVLAELNAIDSAIREREAAALIPCDQVTTGRELAARQSFIDRLRRELIDYSNKRQLCLKRVNEQNAAVMLADREVRLLQRLKENARIRWQQEADRELEALASEAYLAKWAREQGDEMRRARAEESATIATAVVQPV